MTRTKSATATLRPTDSAADAGPGSFEGVLSAPSRDRDGDVLHPDGWQQPLPDQIPISMDHDMSVGGVIGSAQPYLDSAGNLCVRGVFADTEQGQRVRQLVAAGHLRGLSVEFLDHGDGTRDLLGGSVVYAPANADARVTAAKSVAAPADDGDAPQVEIDGDQLAQFISDVAALQGLGAADLPAALQVVSDQLDALAPWLADGDATTDDDADLSGAADGANAVKSAAVDLTAKSLLAELAVFD
ncbi:hypothetical protein ACLQ3C_09270 [Gordonia sp. DT30]|uniref:hypothetical protein n=1 Tax=Gordonia sp. DT30 TaxID=3416546 RepID=UPI003CF56D9B